jgi:hypothetical protein
MYFSTMYFLWPANLIALSPKLFSYCMNVIRFLPQESAKLEIDKLKTKQIFKY